MPGALSNGVMPPPAPNPQPQASQGPLSAPLATQPVGGAPPGATGQQPSGPPPPPSHAQTVAALRHFDAIEAETRKLLMNPDCGKADLRSEVIDGVTGLVSRGIVAAADAVKELAQFPDQPFQQKKWLENHFAQATQAQTAILQLHQHGAMSGMPLDQTAPDPDNHQGAMSGLVSQLRGGANG